MALTFVSSTPASGATDYFINKSLELTYNEPIALSSLTDEVVFLLDVASGVVVPCTIALKATDNRVIVVTARASLKENSNYKLVVIGTAEGLGISLVATNADTLTDTTVVIFATGDNVYQIDTTIEKQAANLTLEGDLFLPTNVKALGYDFTISKVRPKNHSNDVPVNITGDNLVRFTFTKALLTGQANYTDWAEVNVYPLLQDPAYLAVNGTIASGVIPSYSVSVSGSDLLVTFASDLPQNVAVNIKPTSFIKSIDNEEYGGAMDYVFNSDMFPGVYGPEMVKRELSAISDQLNDDYIGALLFKNAIFLWEKLGKNISLSNLSFAAKRYILFSTILDIIEDKDYHKFVLAGTRRQLGDLNVSVDNLVGRLALKVARTQRDRDIAFETLVQGWQFKTLAGAITSSIFDGGRLWYNVNNRYTDSSYKYYQPDLPVSNIDLNRFAKTNNPFW